MPDFAEHFRLLLNATHKVALVTPIGLFQGQINDDALTLSIMAKAYQFKLDEELKNKVNIADTSSS